MQKHFVSPFLHVLSFEVWAVFGHDFFVVGDFVVEPFHGGFELVKLLLQAGTLLDEDFLAGGFGAFFEEQIYIFNQGFYLHTGIAHAFGEFYPAAGGLIKVPDAVFFAWHMGDKTDTFIVADSIWGDAVFFADFFNSHIYHLGAENYFFHFNTWSRLQVKSAGLIFC